MTRNLFSVPIFFIVFRETLEAAIIVSVLLGLAEQIVSEPRKRRLIAPPSPAADGTVSKEDDPPNEVDDIAQEEAAAVNQRRLIRKLRFQIFLGAGLGLFVALAIGAAFIAVWFTKASDLWARSEALWEGIFELIASIMIFVMGITMLKMDRAKAKWRIKLQRAFDGKNVDRSTKTGKWALFILPLITVLREGMEAVIFVGGVSLGQPATSIPIAAIVGLVCGLLCGFLIYEFASRSTLTIFLITITNLLLLIGAGLFSKAVGAFEENRFNQILGPEAGDADAAGDGPGSYRVQGSVWHLNCCNPENKLDGQGWSIFAAIFGWTNSANFGTILSYIFYWLAVIAVLIYLKFKEGRTTFLGRESAAGERRRLGRLEKDDGSESANSDGKEREQADTGARDGILIDTLPR